MANNLVVQLLLKTGTFSTDLKTARGQIQNFQQGCSTAGKSLDAFGKGLGINIGALTKFGTVIGIAAAAGKGFKDVMESTQTTSDAFYGAIEGCKGVVEAFKVSLATADFSSFQNGLWGIFDAAKAARDALDDLGDAQLAYGYKSTKNRREALEQENIYKTATDPAMKEAARQRWEEIVKAQEEAAANYSYKNLNALRSTVAARNTNIQGKDVTIDVLEEALGIFESADSDKRKEEARMNADKVKKEARKYKDDSKREQYYAQHQRELVLDTLLQMKDDTIKAVVQEAQAADAAKAEAASMRKTFNRATNKSGSGGGGGSSTVKEEIQLQEESYSWWSKLAQKLKEHRDAEVYDSAQWNAYNDELEEAVNKMEQINALTERAKTNAKYGTDILTPITGPNLTGQVVNTKPSGLAEDVAKEIEGWSINEINEKIKRYKELAADVKGNAEQMAFYNQQIAVLGERVKELEGIGIPEVKKETINTWDEFNSAMANTSTIVSSLTNTFKEGSELTAASILSMVSTALPALGSLISSIEALTAAEAVEAGVAATGKAVSSSKHWIEAIAAVAALGATVAAALASARSQKSQRFANGGIVGGSSFTGDRVTAHVNSGEMILNRSQQANLFRMANGGLGGNNEVEFHISGTDLVGVLNNYNRKNRIIR